MNCQIKSLYLCVKNMKRAIKFYELFFEQEVTKKDEIYSVFDINGFRIGLFDFKKQNEVHEFGSNCLPSISFDDISTMKKKSETLEIIFPLTQIGENWVAEFMDSEGNHIEITCPVA